ncbi:MAG: class I SAM-dependent methyltransferase, partial [Rhodobacteraceae bacterium]|nr:class I SAM-dependent methyltransferase [Paracoccaceae bacterium]
MALDGAEALDVSMFSRGDLLNLILQRSEVLDDIPRPGRLIKAWTEGNPAPLEEQVERLGPEIARRAFARIRTECEVLDPVLKRLAPKRVADIGCAP